MFQMFKFFIAGQRQRDLEFNSYRHDYENKGESKASKQRSMPIKSKNDIDYNGSTTLGKVVVH